MDRVFENQETGRYEAWLDTASGRAYQRASRALLDRVLDWRRGWRILEVGCGLGVHLAHLKDRGLLLTGLEAGPVMARLAAQRLGPQVDIDLGDAHDLPYEDNSFDAVIMVNTLELVDRRAQVLAEAARVAASRVCLITLNTFSPSGLFHLSLPHRHPLHRGRPLSLMALWRLVREVLGPVPQAWAGALTWPGPAVGHWPFGALVGVCAAVTPRFATRPLLVKTKPSAKPVRPVPSHGRVVLHRVK